MESSKTAPNKSSIISTLFSAGFRIFFLGAATFAIISIAMWSAIYVFELSPAIELVSDSQWHAHEMIYGYALAVIAGFLLTAVKNWTKLPTASGKSLALIFTLWATARLLLLQGTSLLAYAAIFDISFIFTLIIFIARPIIKSKQWRQSFILTKLLLISCGNILFYLGAFEVVEDGIFLGLYGGLYLVIAIILTIGRRVVPFFIEKGVGYEVKLFNSKLLDISSMLMFLGFFVSELFLKNAEISAYFALLMFCVNAARLIGWHTKGIWQKSLLWSLYLSLWFICLGLLLFAATYFFEVSKFLAIHAFAFGGIGLVTISMMSRVTLGHGGGNVAKPSMALNYAFGIMILGAIIRVLLPLLDFFDYTILIGLSQLCWITSFAIFIVIYLPIFVSIVNTDRSS